MPPWLPLGRVGKRSGYGEAVHPDTRALPKEERQRLIASVVGRRRIGTQLELAEALGEAGCAVTQATLSRDLRELGIGKIDDELGLPRYVLPERPAGPDPRAALAAILARFGREVTSAQNIVVIRSELGSAPAIARALDRVRHPLVVGTLAGDDTCLVVAASAADASTLAAELA
jgi:transcriptional regulator of arginine metabolism